MNTPNSITVFVQSAQGRTEARQLVVADEWQ